MLEVHDIRETRVYQEAKEKGLKEGKEKGLKEGMEKERQRTLQKDLRSISVLAGRNESAEEIADILGLDVDFVRQHMPKKGS